MTRTRFNPVACGIRVIISVPLECLASGRPGPRCMSRCHGLGLGTPRYWRGKPCCRAASFRAVAQLAVAQAAVSYKSGDRVEARWAICKLGARWQRQNSRLQRDLRLKGWGMRWAVLV